MRILELCCGTGNISRAFMELGWEAVGVDITDHGYPGKLVLQSVEDYHTAEYFDVIWASPPCAEFSKAKLYAYGTQCELTGMQLVHACWRIIQEVKPKYWIMENVAKLSQFIGEPADIVQYGPTKNHKAAYLWGKFPPIGMLDGQFISHTDKYGNSDIRRAAIPEPLAKAVAWAIHSSHLPISNS